MSQNEIDSVFVEQFQNDAKQAYQQKQSYLTKCVQRQMNVTGSQTIFYKYGALDDDESTPTRGGDIPIDDSEQDAVPCTLADSEKGILRKSLDIMKTSTDQRKLAAESLTGFFARRADTKIINAAASSSTVVGDYTTGLTKGLLASAKESIAKARKYGTGRVYALLHQHTWEEFKNLSNVGNRDYVGDLLPQLKGVQSFFWDDIYWSHYPDLRAGAGGANTTEAIIWEETALGYGANTDNVVPAIDWVPIKRAYLIASGVSNGAVLVDTEGCVRIKLASNVAIT